MTKMTPFPVTRRALGRMAGTAMLGCAGAGWARDTREGVLEGEYQSRGQAMPVLIVPPTGEGALSGASLMMLHGSGGLGADYPTFIGPARRWAAMGCAIIMPVYFSADRLAPARDPVDWWDIAVGDAAKWMESLPGCEVDRQGVFGYSRGGYLAGEVAVTRTNLKAVVGVASAGNVDPAEIVRKPDVLVIRASADPVIPPLRSRRWIRVLREKGVPVEEVVLSSPRHNFTEAEWRRIFSESETFFLRTLARSTPATG